jgi:hypothetical protein
MNLTVGPHSNAVYWRRRAVIVAPLLVLFFTVVSCVIGRGPGPNEARIAGVPASSSPVTRAPGPVKSTTPTDPGTPGSGSSQSAPSPAAGAVVPSSSGPAGTCADKSLALTAVPSDGKVRIGEFARFRLVVKNASTSACRRDLGADEQELIVQAGTKTVWSSDNCARDRAGPADARDGSIRTIVPGEVLNYFVKWGGTSSTTGCATGAPVSPGKYTLVARLGTLRSPAAPFTVTN